MANHPSRHVTFHNLGLKKKKGKGKSKKMEFTNPNCDEVGVPNCVPHR